MPPIARKLILASASPRRRELLAAAGIDFEVVPAAIPEQQREGESAAEFVCRMASEKAEAARLRVPPPCLLPVLGADTVVVLGSRTLGKPLSSEEASQMLRWLSGKEHQVLTGLCLLYPPPLHPPGAGSPPSPRSVLPWKDVRLASTTVKFSELSEQEIQDYVATGEPLDKAGAYAIQGRASKFVEWISGCYFNVVGLPVSLVYQMLTRLDAAAGTNH